MFGYKSTGKVGLFDREMISAKLSKLGNPLEKLHKVIDFEMFRMELEDNILNQDKKSNAGQKPYDVVLMFKILLLKRYYNLSDEQAEYQIIDRLSFKDFLGLSSGDKVPLYGFFKIRSLKKVLILSYLINSANIYPN